MTRLRKRVEYGITLLGSGVYWVRLRGKALGTFPTLEQAQARRDAVIRLIRSRPEQVMPTAGTTVDDLYKLARARRLENEHRNVKTDDNRWATNVSPFLGSRIAKELRPRDVQEFLRALAVRNKTHRCKLTDGGRVTSNKVRRSTSALCPHCGMTQRRLSNSTQRHCLNLLRVVLEFGVQEHLLTDNPARGIRVRREDIDRERRSASSTATNNQLLNAIPLPQRHLVKFAMFTGLRLGELHSLELTHVHLDGQQPFIEVRFGGAAQAPTRLGVRVTFRCYRPRRFAPGLPRYRSGAARTRLACLLFPRERGTDNASRRNTGAGGLPRPPDGASAFMTCAIHVRASSIVQLGRRWSFEEVREMLGHSDIKTTQLYGKLTSASLMRAAMETTTTSRARGPLLRASPPRRACNQPPARIKLSPDAT